MKERVFQGVGVNHGLACGRLCFFSDAVEPSNFTAAVPLYGEDARSALQKAMRLAAEELTTVYARAIETVGEEEAQIFQIHGMLLEDEDFADAILEELEKGKSATEALDAATVRFREMLKALNDPYLSAREADLGDVSGRIKHALLRVEQNKSGSQHVEEPRRERIAEGERFLLVAEDLTPSQTVMLDKSRILGFITFHGTPNSHTAILARAMGIPALVSVGEIDRSFAGEEALLDAAAGTLTVRPNEQQKAAFMERQKADNRLSQEHERYLRALMNKPAVTRSGHRMLIYANIGDGTEVSAALSNGADGIGLLRSEFLYLGATDYPDEETLFRAYRDVAVQMNGKRAVIRTLDIGADKQISYFGLPKEENPALGFRAIRICLERESLFRTQLRAILRASAYGRLSLMLPMIVSVDEVRRSRRLLSDCMRELQEEGQSFDGELELGIMIETPAAAVMSAELAREVDFFSVGTNDLTQYTLAADRQNPALAQLCEENSEPVLRLVEQAARAIHEAGGWIGICGEMAADLHLTQRFADMRIDELSVSVPYLLGVRGRVTECL